eukprot:TRINITY_DN94877_c0_g1_i1.p1 TRINITY_DN94877_c0_g1~~TRINITY_DN94877_c0_g1_i1.p1  ORF type:complete len:267 (-),score=42.82 TRINITY_DN94877_c0_g1_i1:32-832(-)
MPRIGIVFELRRCDTRPGETVCVCGSLARLGAWHPESAEVPCRLQTSPGAYPQWTSQMPLWLDYDSISDQEVSFNELFLEYKYVKDCHAFSDARQPFHWEADIPNRSVALPLEDGAVFMVSDRCWNNRGDPIIRQVGRIIVPSLRLDKAAPAGKMSKDMPKWNFILSPRPEVDRPEFAIEAEFRALDTIAGGCQAYMNERDVQELQALRKENAMLRKWLQHKEERQETQDDSRGRGSAGKVSRSSSSSSSPEVTTRRQSMPASVGK